MKTINVQVKAVVGDRVQIKDIDCKSIVLSVSLNRCSTLYEVAYFHNGDRKVVYLQENEFFLIE